ncbi:threonine/serine ThrE exporter family protein [Nocardia wallacei]|uniref:threonine/serine ThrE exporter family protein n=1 Tax=Nocardia wallacei TaxID=480035 RepID=UPI002455436C|nr:threonine/serine exporter family protein [Nocardia wallacei]
MPRRSPARADMGPRDAPRRWSSAAARLAGPVRDWIRGHHRQRAEAPRPDEPPIPTDLLDLLRRVGVALIGSVETTNRVQVILEDLAHRYGYDEVRFFVLPTAVFVRVEDAGGNTYIDLLDADVGTLRLDQIDRLYRLIAEIKRTLPPPARATAELETILDAPPPTAIWLQLLGNVVLTLGLGMMLNPSARALVGYCVLGLVVQVLIMLADRFRLLRLALPVAAGATVTLLAFGFPAVLSGGYPTQLIVPAVAALLPGAVLTNGTIELATGSMVAGSSRLVYGINMLFLLAFGILVGLQIIGTDPHRIETVVQLGWWAPVLGVLLIGLGHSWRSSAPPDSILWLLVVLYATYCAQELGKLSGGDLFGAFLGGLVAVPAAYLIQRDRHAPPVQVVFLPAFWMLVPGTIGLTGVSELVTGVGSDGVHVIVTTLLTIMAIALGVMVGSGLVATKRPHLMPMVQKLLPEGTSITRGRESAHRDGVSPDGGQS